jgi:hypothetical protein
MAKISGRLLATALAVWLAGASAARAEFMGWTYNFDDSGLTINPNAGQASGSIGVALPPGGSATSAIPDVILAASTSALGTPDSPADQFKDVGYFVTLTIADPAANKSHDFTFHGLLNGSMATGNFQITNAFSDGPSQDSTFAGHDYHVSVGPFVLSQTTGAGSIGFAVQVTDAGVQGQPNPPPNPPPPSTAPEPASLVLVCLALPALGLTSWRRKKGFPSRA